MQFEGNILKMRAEYASPVNYFLPVGSSEINMNNLLGKEISLNFTGQINCISCGKQTKTSFGQGFCYNCLQTAPEASESVVRPELSKAHLGIARDMDWAIKHDLINHHVYLAVSGDVKVGVTRFHQVPTRWIDQGASSAIKIATVPNRHIAGVIEVFLKKYFETDDYITQIEYPVMEYPLKLNSLSFDKQPLISGILKGIKGQYLIFDQGNVLNIRKHNGYWIQLKY